MRTRRTYRPSPPRNFCEWCDGRGYTGPAENRVRCPDCYGKGVK